MPVANAPLTDEEYIIMRAKEVQKSDKYAAKAWMLTAKTLFPANFNLQFEAYLMEKQSGHVKEAADCFSSLMMSCKNIDDLLPEITSIANGLKTNDQCFLSQMFEHIHPDMQHTILRTSLEHCTDTMEHCKLLVLLLKRFPQRGLDGLVKTLMNAEKLINDNRYSRLLVVETLPLLGSLESPRLLQRLLIKAIDFYNSYVHNDSENDITDPWQRLYSVLELLGKQLGWDNYFTNYSNSLNKESYFQKLLTLRTAEDCRQLLYCGTIFLLRSLHDQSVVKGNHILVEAFSDPELPPSKRKKGDIEVTGVSAHQFQAAANCWDLLHCNEVIMREFTKLANQLTIKPWVGQFTEELALYRDRFEEAVPIQTTVSLQASLMRVSVAYCQNLFPACLDNILIALTQLPSAEGVLETDLIVGGTHRHLHFLPMTKTAIVHFFCMLLTRILMKLSNSMGNTDTAFGHIMVLMQLGWPQDEVIFTRILDSIRQRGKFRYPLFQSYIINIEFLEEFMYLWNEHSGSMILDIFVNSQQHLGQRRIGTRGADKGVKEDFKQAMKAQVSRCNESVLNLIIQFINQERIHLLQM